MIEAFDDSACNAKLLSTLVTVVLLKLCITCCCEYFTVMRLNKLYPLPDYSVPNPSCEWLCL